MLKSDFVKYKLKLLDEAKEKIGKAGKEYSFSLDAESAAKLELMLEAGDYDCLRDYLITCAHESFDLVARNHGIKSGALPEPEGPDELMKMIKKMMG